MVRIVRRLEPPLTEEQVFKFKVYRSPKDGKSVLGYLEPYGVVNSGGMSVTWYQTEFGVPADVAFPRVIEIAKSVGMETILIQDADGLFPEQQKQERS